MITDPVDNPRVNFYSCLDDSCNTLLIKLSPFHFIIDIVESVEITLTFSYMVITISLRYTYR